MIHNLHCILILGILSSSLWAQTVHEQLLEISGASTAAVVYCVNRTDWTCFEMKSGSSTTSALGTVRGHYWAVFDNKRVRMYFPNFAAANGRMSIFPATLATQISGIGMIFSKEISGNETVDEQKKITLEMFQEWRRLRNAKDSGDDL